MITEKIKLYENREDVVLTSYILDDSPEMIEGKKRPAIIICPGGAYLNCSDREAEPIALKFANMGYHAFVLRYSTYQQGQGGSPDPTKPVETKKHTAHPNPMREIGMAMTIIKEHEEEWFIDTNKIALCSQCIGISL